MVFPKVVLGFNSRHYDLNLIKKYFVTHIAKVKVANKQNKVMSISMPSVKFLDIISCISPWTSYDKWVKMYNAQLSKAWFPYECFDTAEKLDFQGLLPHKEWISKLKNSMTLTKRVQGLQLIYWVKGIQNFADWLHFHSNLDLESFLEALETTQDFYTGREIDLFKDGVSLLRVSMKYLLHSTLNKRNAPGVVCPREGSL